MISFDLSNLTPEEQEKILNGPALPPPSGVVPNFDNPPAQNHWGILTNVICLTITLVVIGLRTYAKIFCVKKLRFEDYLIPPALATYVGTMFCDFWMIRDGVLFVHQWDVRVKELGKIIYILHVGANLCAVTIMILKAAILLEWIRIFVPPGTRNPFFWTSTILLGLHTFFYIAWIITENLSCIPHRRIWDLTIAHAKCIDVRLIYVPAAAINLLADIIILFLPQRTIWTLHMTIKKKIGVALVFTIGILACLSAGIRLQVTLIFYASEDIVFTEGGMYLWALAEMTCLFLVFCVPSIPRVFVEAGLKARVNTVLSWCSRRTKTGDSDSDSSPQLAVANNRPRSSVFRSRQETLYSVDSVWGPTIEITAGGYDDHTYQGMKGILRTREISTEITPAAKDPSNAEGTGEGEYEKHPRSMLR